MHPFFKLMFNDDVYAVFLRYKNFPCSCIPGKEYVDMHVAPLVRAMSLDYFEFDGYHGNVK